jgi:hypothetical protein
METWAVSWAERVSFTTAQQRAEQRVVKISMEFLICTFAGASSKACRPLSEAGEPYSEECGPYSEVDGRIRRPADRIRKPADVFGGLRTVFESRRMYSESQNSGNPCKMEFRKSVSRNRTSENP